MELTVEMTLEINLYELSVISAVCIGNRLDSWKLRIKDFDMESVLHG